MLKGCLNVKFNSFELITALITPFKNNKIDYLSLKKIITYQLENNISSFVLGSVYFTQLIYSY